MCVPLQLPRERTVSSVPLRVEGTSLAAPRAEPAVALAPCSARLRVPTRLNRPLGHQSLSLLKSRLPGSADLCQSSLHLPSAFHGKMRALAVCDALGLWDAEIPGEGTRQGPDNPTKLRRHVHSPTGERTPPGLGSPLSLLVRWQEGDRMSPWSCLL